MMRGKVFERVIVFFIYVCVILYKIMLFWSDQSEMKRQKQKIIITQNSIVISPS